MAATIPDFSFTIPELRRALKHIRSLRKLGQMPLAKLPAVQHLARARGYSGDAGMGAAIKEVLVEGIQALRPEDGPPDPLDRRWRPYLILTEQYLQQRSADAVAGGLSLSKSAYFEAQSDALAQLAQWLHAQSTQLAPVTSDTNALAATTPFLAPPSPFYGFRGQQPLYSLMRVKDALMRDISTVVGITGPAGIGKSALAIAAAHDRDLIGHFAEGILWVGVGQQPNFRRGMKMWLAALGQVDALKLADDEEEAVLAQIVRRAIGLRRMMIVLDDVWEAQHAASLMLGGPNCAYLITTRIIQVATQVAHDIIVLDALDIEDSMAVLAQFIPDEVSREATLVRKLAAAAHGIPLALVTIGADLRFSIQGHRKLAGCLLSSTLSALQRSEQNARDESAGVQLQLPPTVVSSLRLSLDHLSPAARAGLFKLREAFKPNPTVFSEADAWSAGITPAILDELVNHNLLRVSLGGNYTLHRAFADCLEALSKQSALGAA